MAGERESLLRALAVPLLLALLVGGSAPWWTKYIFPEPTSPPATAAPGGQVGPTTGPMPPATTPGSVIGELTDCVLKISFPFVTMYAEADLQSEQTGSVPPGEYRAAATTVVEFAGRDQRWFQVTAEGRTGWIFYDTIQIESKSAGCP